MMPIKVSLVFFQLSLLFLLGQCAPYSSYEHSLSQRSHITGQAFFQVDASGKPKTASMEAPPKHTSTSSETVSPSVPLVMAYYPDWAGDALHPEDIWFEGIDWLDFAFVWPNEQQGLEWDSEGSPDLLARLVQSAHAAGKYVKLSVGGWTGSSHFSSAVATEKSRSVFANNIIALYHKFGLDGIDIDWEYPGQRGFGGNEINKRDSANLLTFFQLLRQKLPPNAKITAAVQTVPFFDENKQPMKDVSAFAAILDWVLLMNYDIWGASSEPGPNAPLMDVCGNSTQPDGNALSGFNAWTAAGFPADQIVLGVPSYGYISASDARRLRQRSSWTRRDLSDDLKSLLRRGNVWLEGEGGPQIQFNQLVEQGALALNKSSAQGASMYSAAGGFTKYWDECSATPYLRSENIEQVITYDDPDSLRRKAEFAKGVGIRGVNMFDVHGDTEQWELVKGVRQGLGLPEL